MNNFEELSHLIAKTLNGEAVGLVANKKNDDDHSAATQVFIRTAIEPFLPEKFGIGHGRVIDAFGNQSDYLDIIIYNKDFPRLNAPGMQSTHLLESVLAVFLIRANLVEDSLTDALNRCASMADLNTSTNKSKLARGNGLTKGTGNQYVHSDPMRTARFDLIGRPAAFVFGFNGMQQSHNQLQQNIEQWMEQKGESRDLQLKSLPAVVATQGCFAWRNAAPLSTNNQDLLGIGDDSAPVRLIILQLLYLLNQHISISAASFGLKPTLRAYLNAFTAPKFEQGVGSIADSVSRTKPVPTNNNSDSNSAKPQNPAPVDGVIETLPSLSNAAPVNASSTHRGVMPVPINSDLGGQRSSPLGSVPIPTNGSAEGDDFPMPEMVPRVDSDQTPADRFQKPSAIASATSALEPEAVADAIAALTAPNTNGYSTDSEPEVDIFAQTVVVPPQNQMDIPDDPNQSTDAFLAKVKKQLSSPNHGNPTGQEKDSFSTTIPQ